MEDTDKSLPPALAMLSSERPRNLGWFSAAGLLFGDWGTSRLYVLGLAFLVAGRSSIYLIGGMSLLILAVGWAYTHICRIYQNGGGVYTAGRLRSRVLGVVGALLLFADYTVTASLSAVEAFHYFGLGGTGHAQVQQAEPPGEDVRVPHADGGAGKQEPLMDWRSPGLWAIVAIVAIGAFNLMGPKHTAGYAIFTAIGMMAITLLIVCFAVPQIRWSNVDWGRLMHPPAHLWHGFVYIVLALSGVEAIANLTGVMRKPVYTTAKRSIWVVAGEVAVVNLLLAIVMVALAAPASAPAVAGAPQLAREAHAEDMLAFLARAYIGPIGEWPVRIIAGLLLLSAANTAINGLMSIMYVMSRDGEMPAVFQKLNSFGAPWVAAVLATAVPAVVLLFAHDLHTLASLYAIGVVGAVAIDTTLCTIHPRLRKWWRKGAMGGMAVLLVAIWVTLATTKLHALVFVTIVLAVGLALRQLTRWAAQRKPKVSLLRQAIVEQLPPEALAKPRILLATAGSAVMADAAVEEAAAEGAALVVCFVREAALNYKVEAETRLTLDNDPAAQVMFADFLEKGHEHGVPIIPMYDTGTNAAELIAELAALNGVEKVLIGSSRRGMLHTIIKGSFQRKLEGLLPPDIHVQVLAITEPKTPDSASAAVEEPSSSSSSTSSS